MRELLLLDRAQRALHLLLVLDGLHVAHRAPAGQKAYSMTKPIRVEHLKPCVDWWGRAERKGRVASEVAWRVTLDEVKTRGYNLDFKNSHTVADDHGDPEELLAKLDEAERQVAALRDQLKAILSEALLR